MYIYYMRRLINVCIGERALIRYVGFVAVGQPPYSVVQSTGPKYLKVTSGLTLVCHLCRHYFFLHGPATSCFKCYH